MPSPMCSCHAPTRGARSASAWSRRLATRCRGSRCWAGGLCPCSRTASGRRRGPSSRSSSSSLWWRPARWRRMCAALRRPSTFFGRRPRTQRASPPTRRSTCARCRAASSTTRACSLARASPATSPTSSRRTSSPTWPWCTAASPRTPSRRGAARTPSATSATTARSTRCAATSTRCAPARGSCARICWGRSCRSVSPSSSSTRRTAASSITSSRS
mmetsp:Transcript_62362/g.174236  ORF Transcript_62362/g.174236 Transcript_62362/m.174236 type:complete len:216 (-) Transcript_62362:5567-6214(-)